MAHNVWRRVGVGGAAGSAGRVGGVGGRQRWGGARRSSSLVAGGAAPAAGGPAAPVLAGGWRHAKREAAATACDRVRGRAPSGEAVGVRVASDHSLVSLAYQT